MDLDERTSLTRSSREYIEHMGYRARRTCTRARFVEILSFVEYFVEQVSCVERVFLFSRHHLRMDVSSTHVRDGINRSIATLTLLS